ncbi:hypothetical protein bthur0013_59400 [Bacillus thuringiensis IBL 200]|nr:hypothetical protein bthur0013_59400 [Bacillus thuringiensis IBL 200]
MKKMRLNKDDRSLPVLLAYERDESGNLAVWCPYCACWHLHGQGDGHRMAHCQNRRSPFKKTGYVIKKGSSKDFEFKNNTYFDYQYDKLDLKYTDEKIEKKSW